MIIPIFAPVDIPDYIFHDYTPKGKRRSAGTRPRAKDNRTAKRRVKNKLASASRRRNR